jgi:transposase
MRFVPVKSTAQQDVQVLHRARGRLVRQRTALINHTRGLLAEYGVVLPKGAWRFQVQAPVAVAEAELSDLAREIFTDLLNQLDDFNIRLKKLDARIVGLCRSNAACRRLAVLPGVCPIIATAGRSRRRRSSLSIRSRACRLDRLGAETIYHRR